MTWWDALDRFGVAIVALVVLSTAVWRVLTWLAPMAKEIFTKHMLLMDKLGTNSDKHAESINEIKEVVKKQEERLEKIDGRMICRFDPAKHGTRNETC